jgi:flagellar biogenesis protein FliO
MRRTFLFAALGLFALCVRPLAAQSTPAPPNWQDGQGPSVYLAASPQKPSAASANEDARYAAAPIAPPRIDSAIVPAVAQEPAAAASNEPSRKLAPPSNFDNHASDQTGRASEIARRVPSFGLPVQSIYTVVSALAIVIGSFLLFAWAIRRNNRNTGTRRGSVPNDAVTVLGRVPLAARQFAELLRVGNKLVLVAATPNGPTALTEISDPAEVDRIVGLCQQFEPNSATKAFEQVFQQFSNEPAAGGFLGSDPLPASLSSAAATAYRSQRGTGRV